MNTVWIVDGTYLRTALRERTCVQLIANMERELVAAQGAPMKCSLYFDLSSDIDKDMASAFINGLRSNILRTPFGVRLIPLPAAANEDAYHDTHRLLAVEAAVESIRLASGDDCDRLVLTSADAALEPAISTVRRQFSREFWLNGARSHRAPVLEAFADRIIWFDT
ncbi:NYN domain-containing protein [Paraburkholderia sp. BL27I4N3]|uniref:NYN domain-containing protein n=1 Tax=Paraburkholderia sp. BL27I4N3 TaxID=1938805 RepID=UPI0011C073F5|nr:NYN domain-containing protein [Paraburkholderia sp. BL27I4N3]